MTGRDPKAPERAATALELLYDLVFVVAFAVASSELAHSLAAGHAATGILAFGFVMFAVVWAWINFTWFASAYDTNDWLYRVLAMVQMGGLTLLALGIADIFGSIEEGKHLDNGVLVAGYVIMRLGLVAQWARAYRDDVPRRATIRIMIVTLLVAQAGWVAQWLIDPPLVTALIMGLILFGVELSGPVLAERIAHTPWHAHHIAERYGLLAIIALGEGVVGTIGALDVLIDAGGWSFDAIMLLISGIVIIFGMWWTYFMLPSGDVLHHQPQRAFVWGYGHMPLYASIAAVGAGLHVFAYYLDAEHADFDVKISAFGTVLAVAAPLALYSLGLFALYYYLTRHQGPLHTVLMGGVVGVIALGLVAAAAGAPPTVALFIVGLAPWVVVVGFETVGARRQGENLIDLGRSL